MVQTASHDPMVPQVMRVAQAQLDAPDVFTLKLEPETDLPRFTPGQFNMLTAFGVGESAISVSGDPASGDGIVHTIRAVGAVSRALTGLRAGDSLGLRGPFGVGWPMEQLYGKDVILLAGGIGLAPLRPAIYRLLAERERFGEVAILYGTRSPADILFRSEVESWRQRLDVDVHVTVDHADESWHGQVGVVTTLLPRIAFDPGRTVALLCGPEIMMRFGVQALGSVGVPDEGMYLSMERSMKCGIGLCGHCQFSPAFVCKDGPVFRYDQIRYLLALKEL
ncbi:FAD/NAD(P)-binding protein [Bauldia litoralis]|uniref:FAD/NAD(P)-binding protein n=1 Tax=Bauldia litoralis TaxID=665467 RepID=UPI0032675F61